VQLDVKALAVPEEDGRRGGEGCWEAGMGGVDLALEIEQGGDLEVVGWCYFLLLILVVAVGLALLMMVRRIRGEGWHLEVCWWWGSSRLRGEE
jgi:hypothetical protein